MGIAKRIRTLWALSELETIDTPDGTIPLLPTYQKAEFIMPNRVEEISRGMTNPTLDDVIEKE